MSDLADMRDRCLRCLAGRETSLCKVSELISRSVCLGNDEISLLICIEVDMIVREKTSYLDLLITESCLEFFGEFWSDVLFFSDNHIALCIDDIIEGDTIDCTHSIVFYHVYHRTKWCRDKSIAIHSSV